MDKAVDLVRSRQEAGWRGQTAREAWTSCITPSPRTEEGRSVRPARGAGVRPGLRLKLAGHSRCGHQAGWTPWGAAWDTLRVDTQKMRKEDISGLSSGRCSNTARGWSLRLSPCPWASVHTQHTRVFTRRESALGLSLHCSSHPHSSSAAESVTVTVTVSDMQS